MAQIMQDRYFLEIPIYRFDEDKHKVRMQKKKARRLRHLVAHREATPRTYRIAERRFEQSEWYPWRYNEVIGWIHLLAVGKTQVKGELYFVRSARATVRKRFYWAHEAFEIDLYPNQSSAEIYDAICSELEKFRNEPHYKKRYFDLEAFRNIGRFVNWRNLVDSDGQ